jgi:hypothetical protein
LQGISHGEVRGICCAGDIEIACVINGNAVSHFTTCAKIRFEGKFKPAGAPSLKNFVDVVDSSSI